MEQFSPELLKWAIGAIFTVSAAVLSATSFLIVKSYQLGKKEARFEQVSKDIIESKALISAAVARLELLPVHEQRIGQLETLYRKTHSDIRDLLKQVARQEGREEMRSGHDLLPNGE
jgi:hypothetical protein